MKNYILAIATLVGTIIGVGLFTVPYVINKSGIALLFVYMIVLGFIQYYLHNLYAEVVLSTAGDHRLPGYAEKYFGQTGKKITLFLALFSDYGVIISYIIVGGLFLHQLLNPLFGGGLLVYTTILFLFEAFIVLFGLKSIADSEFVMTSLLVMLIGYISWKGIAFINLNNYTAINWGNIFLPYGPIFFAVSGSVAIPEVCKLLDGDKARIKGAIAWGTFLSVLIMTIFAFIVVGISGPQTTPDTILGLSSVLKGGTFGLLVAAGLLVVITSMITLAQAAREIFWWDFKMDKNVSWVLACFAPFILYLLGIQNLTKTVSLVGAFSGGILGIIIIMMVLKIKKGCERESIIRCLMNKEIAFFLSILFTLGFAYEIWNVFFNGL